MTKQFEITFSMPDDITYGHWKIYTDGANAFQAKAGSVLPSLMLRQYHGSLALIKAGIAHVVVSDWAKERVLAWLNADDQTRTPIQLVGLVADQVGGVVERAANLPLSSCFPELSATSTTPNGTSNPTPSETPFAPEITISSVPEELTTNP